MNGESGPQELHGPLHGAARSERGVGGWGRGVHPSYPGCMGEWMIMNVVVVVDEFSWRAFFLFFYFFILIHARQNLTQFKRTFSILIVV